MLVPVAAFAVEDTKLSPANIEAYLRAHSVIGPKDIALANEAIFHLPKGMKFVPRDDAQKILKLIIGSETEKLEGLIYSDLANESVLMTVGYVPDGYIRDNTAENLNADDLLKSLRASSVKENEGRKSVGAKQIKIAGWIEKPIYYKSKHQLVYSLKVELEDKPAGKPSSVNYMVYSLGRDGYFVVDLLSDVNIIDQKKHFAYEMSSAIEYDTGKRYEDFNESTDRVAEYGLAALVGGVVATKLGFLALAGVVILKSIKAIGIALVVGYAGIRKFFFGSR